MMVGIPSKAFRSFSEMGNTIKQHQQLQLEREINFDKKTLGDATHIVLTVRCIDFGTILHQHRLPFFMASVPLQNLAVYGALLLTIF